MSQVENYCIQSWGWSRLSWMNCWKIICWNDLFNNHYHHLQHLSGFFLKKPDEGLWYCTDYWNTNSKTIKNWYPLSLIWEIINGLQQARIYRRTFIWETHIIDSELWKEENISLPAGLIKGYSDQQLCNWGKWILLPIARDIYIMLFEMHWIMFHLPMWILFWYILILKRTM